MAGFLQRHTRHWIEFFVARGYPSTEPLAAGVEGALYRLADGLVAKVWARRSRAELVRLQRFYADVASARLPFATPTILSVEDEKGVAVTFERELTGVPLNNRLSAEDPNADAVASDCLIAALCGLANVAGTEAMRELPVLDERRPLWADTGGFTSALIGLLERRVSRFSDVLRAHVVEFDRKYRGVTQKLASLEAAEQTVIHGDLVPPNMLTDASGALTAVLDFGFLTTSGDRRLDASIGAAVFNMYGPYAGKITDTLTARIAAEFDYSVEVLLLYRAVYALATSNAFTRDGTDGHFLWCAAVLNNADVCAALEA